MGKILDWLVERLSENSTWRGLIALFTAGGITVSPDLATQIIAAGMGLIGIINVFRKAPPSA